MDKCRLHTILRLPTGIFYAQGVKANVLFFTRGKTDRSNTKEVWVYDLRANMPAFGKRTPFTRVHLADFEKAYGSNSDGIAHREPTERFRCFTRKEIKQRDDNLNLSWLRDKTTTVDVDLAQPAQLLTDVLRKLRAALDEMETLEQELTL